MKTESSIVRRFNAPVLSILFTIACQYASTAAFAQSLARDGFWKDGDNPEREYAHFLKIEGDKGFYCVLDDKSSFAFRIIGDSITTPMNGKDHIQFFSGRPDVVISGEEKGEAYSNVFVPLGGTPYPTVCVEEEAAEATTGIARRPQRTAGPATRFAGRFSTSGLRDALGRVTAPSASAPR
ncbi:MAG: hypothetical protein ABIW76_20310 [Fibrobacteria bacterium]